MPRPDLQLEFRIPISPSERFYSQVRFFNFALRRLQAQPYREARLCVVVGDHCDLDAVRRQNSWSENFNVVWERVPDDVFEEFHWWGNANWRLNIPPGNADIVILADADTVLLRDIDPLLDEFPLIEPTLFGHIAHLTPHHGVDAVTPSPFSPAYWPWLFGAFEIPWPDQFYRYAMDMQSEWPLCPAYFNLGFLAMNREALAIFARMIAQTTRRLSHLTGSIMRCQIAMTIMAYRAGIEIRTLATEYNAQNRIAFLNHNETPVDRIRVLHYQIEEEIKRTDLQPDLIDDFLSRSLTNPANFALQNLAREYRETLR